MTYLRNNYDLSIILGIIMTYLRNNYDLSIILGIIMTYDLS